MQTQILTPLLRSTIGFDRFDRLFEQANRRNTTARAYPPYNIEKTSETEYRITMAVAGFAENDLDVTQLENVLVIKGDAKAEKEAEDARYLHRGIAKRAFERRFELADGIEVTGAKLERGFLNVDLVREIPESQRPRRIEIGAPAAIEGEAQAA